MFDNTKTVQFAQAVRELPGRRWFVSANTKVPIKTNLIAKKSNFGVMGS